MLQLIRECIYIIWGENGCIDLEEPFNNVVYSTRDYIMCVVVKNVM